MTTEIRPCRSLLIVDDEEGVRDSLASFLRMSGFPTVVCASNGREALERLRSQSFFLVITDISMPGLSGIELLARIRSDYPGTDVAVITGHLDVDFAIQALKCGAYDYFRKPFRFEEVLNTVRRVEEQQELRRRSRELELLKERRRAEDEHLKELMITLAKAIDMKSPYTREHSERCSRIAALIAERIGLTRAEVERVALGARLHDIGKLGTPDCILDKAGRLTDEEFGKIREHPLRGAELLQNIPCLAPVVSMIRWHHENMDGTGYPDGLVGQQIPLDARIVRVSDYWDAITSYRSYRDPMSVPAAIKTIEAEVENRRLDGDLVRVLFDCVKAGLIQRAQGASVRRVGGALRSAGATGSPLANARSGTRRDRLNVTERVR